MTVARRKPREQHGLAAALGFDTPDGTEFIEALRRENDQLRTALRTRIVIEQAKGMLAERLGLEVDVAFERLRREARTRRMKLHAFAAAVVAREAWSEPLFQPGAGGNAEARPARATASRHVHRA
jgi:AmiR/NasT family two-component response regulator